MKRYQSAKKIENDTYYFEKFLAGAEIKHNIFSQFDEYLPVQMDFLSMQYLKSDYDYTYC